MIMNNEKNGKNQELFRYGLLRKIITYGTMV